MIKKTMLTRLKQPATRFTFRSSFLFSFGLLFFSTLMFNGVVHARSPHQMGEWGVGADVGSISSVSLQYTINPQRSAVLGAILLRNDGYGIYGDYLWHLAIEKESPFHPYVGMGGGLGIIDRIEAGEKDDLALLVRLPAGLSYYRMDSSLNFFAQIVAHFNTAGASFVSPQVGIRYFFE